MKTTPIRSRRPHRAFVPPVLAGLVLALALPGACSRPEAALRSTAPAADTGAAAGEAAVRADSARLTRHVAWLADDAQEGRRAGTPAGERSGRWIAERLAELGLEPAGSEGWLQQFPVPLAARDGGSSSIEVGGRRFAGAEAVVPLFCSDGAAAAGPLVFAGYGLTSEERGWDDYRDVDAQGAVVLLVRGTPPLPDAAAGDAGDDTALVASGGGWGGGGSLFTKVMTAKRHGAAAVVIAPHPDAADEPLLAFDASRTAQASLPALYVSADVARRLVDDYDARVRAFDAASMGAARGDDADTDSARRTGAGQAADSAGGAAAGRGGAREVAVVADVVRGKGPAFNVLGRLPGEDPGAIVVVGAHYDHLGRGGEGSLDAEQSGAIHNGADDNASGTAAVIEIARLLSQGAPPACDVVFALWSGEELGLLGSEHWARHPTVPLERVVANLNLDMVGRAGDGQLAVLGAGTAGPFEAWLAEAAPRAQLELDVSRSGQGIGGSDHQTFLKRQIPALHFFSGIHTDYHKPSDDVERVEIDGTRRVVELCVDLVRRIAGAGELAYVEVESAPDADQVARMRSGWSVWFGTVPEYAYDGKGLLLAGTSDGSPAEKAGLLSGDVIVQVGEIGIDTIYDFMHALQTYKPGDVVLTRYLRDGAEQSVRVTLGTREAH